MAKRDFMGWFLREGFAGAAANSLLYLVQLSIRGHWAAFFEKPYDVVQLGHHTLIRSPIPIPD